MPKLILTARDGSEREIAGQAGTSVMEVVRDNGVDELLALCGGACSCATCHVYADLGSAPGLPAMGADEDALLEGVGYRRPESRLSCQITFTDALDGLRITIAAED